MRKIFLLLLLVINIIANTEIKKEEVFKSHKKLRSKVKNYVENLNFLDDLLNIVLNYGEYYAMNECNQRNIKNQCQKQIDEWKRQNVIPC